MRGSRPGERRGGDGKDSNEKLANVRVKTRKRRGGRQKGTSRELLAGFTNDSELQAELGQRLVVIASDGVTDAEELRRQALANFPLA